MPYSRMHIGIDDTDSTRGGCTTYVAALLVEKLEKLGVRFVDYVNLVRLNPNVPWKTRGNGALCLRIEYNDALEAEIKETAISIVEKHSEMSVEGTDPGIVFLTRPDIPEEISVFAKKTETSIVTLKEALSIVRKFGGEALGFNTRMGVIGALAAIGEILRGDHTFEVIAYRVPKNYGTKRKVDEDSIFEMDRLTQPRTFNNVDVEKHRVIITPRGPDPILLGIRGETPEIVRRAFRMVKPLEPVERWLIFRTNQGTDAHLTRANSLRDLKPYNSVVAKGVVSRNPRIVPLRHVIFSIDDAHAEVDCAAYEPTGDLRKIASQLIAGDCVEVYGAVRECPDRERLTVNLEKINILELAEKKVFVNPACPTCQKRVESMGKGKGFRCRKCGARFIDAKKVEVVEERGLRPGLYVTSTRSQRHLTKPLRRYGLEKHAGEVKMIFPWHS